MDPWKESLKCYEDFADEVVVVGEDWDYEFSIFVSLCLIKPNKEKVLPEYLGEILNTTFVFNQAKNLTKTDGCLRFLQMQLFRSLESLMALLGTSWSLHGPIWSQNGSQHGPKSSLKSV